MNKFRLTYLLVALALIAAACGQSEPDVQAAASQLDGVSSSEVAPLDDQVDADNSGADSGDDGADGTDTAAAADTTSTPAADDGSDTSDAGADDSSTTSTASASTAATTLDSAEGQLMLAAVVADTEAASTGRFEGRLVAGLEPGSSASDVTISINGSFDLGNDATELTIDLSQITALMEQGSLGGASGDDPLMGLGMFPGMFDDPIRLINVGDRGYLQWPFITSLFASFSADGASSSVPASELWIEGTSDDLGGAADGLGAGDLTDEVLPTDLLDQLRSADATVEDLGPDTVRGAATTHYRVTMDAEAMAAAAGDELSDEERAELENLDGQIIDLWVDDEGLARKILMVMDESSLASDDGSDDLGSMGLTSVTFEFELFDLGAAVDIAEPPADSVLASDDLGLGFDDSSFES